MKHHKNNYHPLMPILFRANILTTEVIKQIPRSTRHAWHKNDFSDAYGFQYCALYAKHFNNVARAHKYTFTRYIATISNAILGTLLAMMDSQAYKKLCRTQAHRIVQHITDLALKGFSLKKACKLFGVNSSWYQYHKRKINCPKSQLRICFKKQPLQLTFTEQNNIRDWINKESNQCKNLTHLYYEALNNAVVSCSKSIFNTYAHLYGYTKVFRKPKAKQKKGFRATQLFEYLHIDTTYILTVASGMQKIIMIKDNFSKAILHYKRVSTSLNSFTIKEVLQETFDKYKLFERTHQIQIISDGGSENKGEVITWTECIKAPPCVKKIIAKTPAFPYSNSMIEGSFNLFKHDYLKGKIPYDDTDCDKKIVAFIDHCSNRYFGELYGLTPKQVLDGQIPNKDRFKQQLLQARTNRIATNQIFNGCTVFSC